MTRIGLISCGKAKLTHAAPAAELYTSTLFRWSAEYCRRYCDRWAILSAKHFVVLPDQVIEPYDLTLEDLDVDYRRQWIGNVNWQLYSKFDHLWELVRGPEERFVMEPGHVLTHRRVIGIKGVEFVVLAGEAYAQGLTGPFGRTYPATFPLRGLGVGQRLRWLKTALEGNMSQVELQFKSEKI